VVDELISTQAEDGYLGPFAKKDRLLGNWDLWGHYHVMEALLLWNERTGDKKALEACTRAADLICNTYLEGGRRVFDAGSHEMNMAVIHGLGMLYRATGSERYFRLMREIEKDWERAGDYFRTGLAGTDFYRTPRPRWESLHDLQGLVELYRITGDERYKKAFVSLWKSIARLDRHNTGGFSSGEQAVGDPHAQGPIETCCTIAWMALSVDMLRLTGDPSAADELELSTFNGMLGAQHPSGRWWTYNTPMDGVREASAHTIVFQSRAGTPELNCCSVNGPRGLGMLSEWAVMAADDGLVLNYYGPMKASLKLKDGTRVEIEQTTDYPFAKEPVKITLHPERQVEFTVLLRIPGWSRHTLVKNGDKHFQDTAGPRYAPVRREWKDGDEVSIDFPTKFRVVAGDRSAGGKISVYWGPILLAFDQRYNSFDEDALPALDASSLEGLEPKLEPVTADPLSPRLLATIKAANGQEVKLCDFASAGATGTRYRSWLSAVNIPPPPVLLDRPRDGESIPPGKALFSWGGKRRSRFVDEHTLLIAAAVDFGEPVLGLSLRANRATLEKDFQPGRDYFWKVIARNAHGATESEVRRFRVDPALPPLSAAALATAEPGPGGLLVASMLRGEARPSFGSLVDTAGVEPAAGPSGEARTALSFDGQKGRVRYAIPYFPERDWTVVIRVSVRALPEGRIGQVFSAWAGPMDDPLRITVDGGRLFARIEAGRGFSTDGVPVRIGEWTQVAAVKSGAKLTLHVNGDEKTSAGVPEEVYSEAGSVALGGNPNFGGNEFLAASLSDFALYARALSAGEIQKILTDAK
jgi:hypothetical protein